MSVVLYNDNESFSAEWMRELTKAGGLSSGDISEDSIKSLKAETLKNYKRVHLFAGIGGWEYALQLAGWPEDWPVWTGSCPCQPFSGAGRGKGIEDERHLWPEMFRLIKGCKPPVIFGEQVASPAGIDWMQSVQADLEGAGYEVGKLDLCAAGLGAPHIRQRIFWVAHRIGAGLERLTWDGNRSDKSRRIQEDEAGSAAESCVNGRLDGTYGQCFPTAGNYSGRWPNATQGFWSNPDWLFCRDGRWRPVEPGTFTMAHGVSNRVGKLRGYGNAIVPQVAAWFIKQTISWIKGEDAEQIGGRE